MVDRQALAERYRQVKASIPQHVTLIAVSKKRTVEEIQALYDLGHRDMGENYPQELRDKAPQLPADIRWHFIGNLQSNKAKYVVPVVQMVHTVDGPRILDELEKRSAAIGKKLEILFQVHIALEETKHGLSPEELKELINNWDDRRWPSITPKGLMGMATNTTNEGTVRKEFNGLKRLFDALLAQGTKAAAGFDRLSMGMSSDASIAIEEGSNMVRIGTAIFGDR